jgi:hypothetical protein
MSGETKIQSMGRFLTRGELGFRVWAPNAQRASVIGSFNDWDGDKMFQKNLILVVTLLSVPVFQSSSLAASGLVGSAAPYFRVQSGDDQELLRYGQGQGRRHILREQRRCGKQQTTKGCIKQTVLRADAERKRRFSTTPHYRLFGRSLALPGAMEKKTREHSKKEGVVIYCDWKRKMSSDYKMKADVSNIVIVDKSGRIRFLPRARSRLRRSMT